MGRICAVSLSSPRRSSFEVIARTLPAPPGPSAPALVDLRRLATLCEVSRRGTFAAAAEALWLTPSAVSQQMAALERELGAALFERTSRGVRPTDAARILVRRADAVFSELAQARRELSELATGRRGSLRVGSFPVATAAFAARVVGRFADAHPSLELHLADLPAEAAVAALAAGTLDLALVRQTDGGEPCRGPELVCVELIADPPAVVLPRDHPLARADVVFFADLDAERVLGAADGADGAPHRSSDPAALQALVAAGLGVAVLGHLELQAGGLRPELVARPLSGAPVARVSAARLASAAPTLAGEALISALRADAARLVAVEQAA